MTGRPRYSIEQLVTLLKGGAASQLKSEGIHPFQDQPLPDGKLPHLWGRGEWNIFIDEESMLLDKIDYTERNALRQRRPIQRWSFVEPYRNSG